MTTTTSKRYYIIDTDAGVDDAIAILMALKYLTPEEFIAITTVHGNVDLPQANHNINVLLAQHHDPTWKTSSLPVHSGASKPLVSMVGQRWPGHGPDGFGGLAGAPPSSSVLQHQDNAAVRALMDLVKLYPPHSITVLALGPLTNVALAIQRMPDFLDRLDHLIFLGGTTSDVGNSTPFAEFNVGCDPEAAQVVFAAAGATKPEKLISVVPFDLCLQHGLSWMFYDRLVAQEHPNAKLIQALCTAFEQVCRGDSFDAFLPADAYAVAIVLHERCVIQKQVRRSISNTCLYILICNDTIDISIVSLHILYHI